MISVSGSENGVHLQGGRRLGIEHPVDGGVGSQNDLDYRRKCPRQMGARSQGRLTGELPEHVAGLCRVAQNYTRAADHVEIAVDLENPHAMRATLKLQIPSDV